MGERCRDYLLVDGYNVIHDWKELKKVLAEDVEQARDHLVDCLASYGAYKNYRVFVVFDAHSISGQERTYPVYSHLAVIFTDENETADSVIEKTAYRLAKAGKRVYVATSDGAEQQLVLGVGACRIPARELREDVLRAAKVMRQNAAYSDSHTGRNEIEGRVDEQVRQKLNQLRLQR